MAVERSAHVCNTSAWWDICVHIPGKPAALVELFDDSQGGQGPRGLILCGECARGFCDCERREDGAIYHHTVQHCPVCAIQSVNTLYLSVLSETLTAMDALGMLPPEIDIRHVQAQIRSPQAMNFIGEAFFGVKGKQVQ